MRIDCQLQVKWCQERVGCYSQVMATFQSARKEIRLYVDDILIYTIIHCLSECQRLQEDLHTLHNSAEIWQMNFNPSTQVPPSDYYQQTLHLKL